MPVLLLNSEGRLAVATKPESYPSVTGDLTAVQATAGTAVAGGTVSIDTSKASNVVFFVSNTFAGYTFIFEGSIDGGVNWFTVQAVRSNANTIDTVPSGMNSPLTHAWELSVNALTNFRVRCTARTSGTATVRIQLGSYATEPIPANPVNTVTVSNSTPISPTEYALAAAATTNAVSVKTTAGRIFALSVSNIHTAPVHVKLYRKTSAPTVGTDVPTLTIPVPASSQITREFGALGEQWGTGIALATTIGAADSATDALPATGLVKIHMVYL